MRRGHTFAELMVVLSILALFAMVVMPRMMIGMRRSRMDKTMNAIRGDLQFARARAASTGLRHQVAIDASTGELLVQAYRPEEAQQGTTSQQAIPDFALRDPLPEEMTVRTWSVSPVAPPAQAVDATTDVLTFYPEGRSDSVLVVVEDDEGTQRGLQLEGFTGELRELTGDEVAQLGR
jgi:prepilin-type N-terminal cleavage/methylation domain-containing protein